MSENEKDEIPSVVSFFSKRAKLVPKVTPEDLKATSELLNKFQESRKKVTSNEDIILKPVKKAPKKGTKNRKKAAPQLKEVKEDVENVCVTPTATLSAAAKKRLKKIQLEKDLELESMEAENEKILSAINTADCCEVEVVPDDNFDKVNVLTVSYLSEISRVTCYANDKFSTIYTKVAEVFHLKVSEFLLSFKEQIIKVEDTPKSLNITSSDILECIPYKADENCETEAKYEGNNLKIMFQTSDSKVKINILVHKLEKMKDVMEKYSKLQGIPLSTLVFEFDGEKLLGTETPEDLDMESGNCIDVRIVESKNNDDDELYCDASQFPVVYDLSDSDSIYEDC